VTPRTSPRPRSLGDATGFTLVELLVTIAILGIIMTPLSAAFVLAIRTSEASNNRIANANDAEILTVFFPPDVHAAGDEAGDVAVGGAAGTTCSGIPNVAVLSGRGQETAAGSTSTWTSAYAVDATGPESWRLVRAHCVDGGAPETFTVAHNLASSSAASAATDGRRVTLTVQGAGTPDSPVGPTVEVSATRRST
jgi:prepilin-type N-terminal cleavage/methylation domain-containing protein